MRSIRLSLILYFLGLVAVALGAVMVVVYQNSWKTLDDKKASTEALLKNQHIARCQAEKDKLDQALAVRVKSLVNLVSFSWGRPRSQPVSPPGSLSISLNPQGSVLLFLPVLWTEVLEENMRRQQSTSSIRIIPVYVPEKQLYPASFPLALLGSGQCAASLLFAPLIYSPQEKGFTLGGYVERRLTLLEMKLHFSEDVLPGNGEGHEAEYCQISNEMGKVWQHSRSLGEQFLTLDSAVTAKLRLLEPSFDEVKLPSGARIRRVTMKLMVPPFLARGSSREAWRSPPSEPSKRLVLIRPMDATQPPSFYIQVAQNTTQRDAALAALDEQLRQELDNLEAESAATLADLRRHLWWISGIAFAATVMGGLWLIRLGLAPLQRLSEAVSQVSTRDFRLPLDPTRLPRELTPIAERLTGTLEMLKRAFAREKQAAADISHELRTPLAALLTTIDVGLRKPRSPEEYREILDDCRTSGQQMGQLVERLLALARLDAGVATLRPREVDVTSLAEQCVALVRPLAEARGLQLSLHVNGPAEVNADADKVREVLTNLLHNAIQYNRPRGAIDLSVERNNGELYLEVRDTGIGIAPEAREHIFERFYRADPSRHADGLNAGLGLAIVKGYVDLMGGTIHVESTPGEGSTFQVRLPIRPLTPRFEALAATALRSAS
jgi:heavy metal sensor kinase